MRGVHAVAWIALVVTSALGLALPAVAHARRDPTPRERAAIARAAARAQGGPTLAVRTHDVRVSTVGPWAAADLEISRRGSSFVQQAAIDTFVRLHGRWIDTAGAGAVDREPPRAVVRDLGLAPSKRRLSWLTAYWLVCWFFGLAAICDVVLQPSRAFRDAGHGKLRWLLVELLAAPLAGVFTWGWYAARIRPAVVAAGGRPPRKWLKACLVAVGAILAAVFAGLAGAASALQEAEPRERPKPETHAWSWNPPRPSETPRCAVCGGSGWRTCYGSECHYGRVYTPSDGDQPIGHDCPLCHGSGRIRCHCGGHAP